MYNLLTITAEDLDAIEASMPTPRQVPGHGRAPGVPVLALGELVVDVFPLTAEDMDRLANAADLAPPEVRPLVHIRRVHHRLAQFLAMGMKESRAAQLCEVPASRVRELLGDPAFQEILAHYSDNVDASFRSFVDAAADLNADMLNHLRDILEHSPERITPQIALETVKALSDRTGNGPVSKNMNLNLNAGFGDRMEAIRARKAALEPSDG